MLLGKGRKFIAVGYVMFVHGTIGIDHAAREVLRAQFAVVAVEGDELPRWEGRYSVIWFILSRVNMPPF